MIPPYTLYKSDLMDTCLSIVNVNVVENTNITVPQGNLVVVFGPPGKGAASKQWKQPKAQQQRLTNPHNAATSRR